MSQPLPLNPEQSALYERVGGDVTFRRLVDAFYRRIEADPLLRPLFPEDLEPGKERQFLFLTQYWGGPDRYNRQRGHPRLRMRHAHVAIGQDERDTWLAAMVAAIDEVGIDGADRAMLIAYFERSATFLINRPA